MDREAHLHRAALAACQGLREVHRPRCGCWCCLLLSCFMLSPKEGEQRGELCSHGSAAERECLRSVKPELLNICSSVLREGNLYLNLLNLSFEIAAIHGLKSFISIVFVNGERAAVLVLLLGLLRPCVSL